MIFNVTASETRRPQAYINSKIARSRRPVSVETSGAGKKDFDLGLIQKLRQIKAFLRRVEIFGRIVFDMPVDHQELVKSA